MERPFMIFIVGTTAVGKTKLSIELCKEIGG
jgi:tRNA A37 N6-isopentenylltransferase MiaA